MYTIDYAYAQCKKLVDKIGSSLFTLPKFLTLFEAATYDFIGPSIKYIENTQEIRDDIRTLYRPLSLEITSLNGSIGICSFPDDYLYLLSIKLVNNNKTDPPVRKVKLIRHGEQNINALNPHSRPTKEYPTVIYYSDYIEIHGGIISGYLKGSYVKKPKFGINQTDIVVDLPDNVVQKIIKKTAYTFDLSVADERTNSQLEDENIYRQRGK